MKQISGIGEPHRPVIAWMVKFMLDNVEMRECITADTESEAEAIVVQDYSVLGLRIEVIDVCRQLRKDQFIQKSIRRDEAKWNMTQHM